MTTMPKVYLLDYVAGNVRSLVNAIEKVGYTVEWVRKPEDVAKADKLILPGVGHFGHCLSHLQSSGFLPAIHKHIASGKPFLGICVGLQALFRSSVESPDVPGLGLIDATLDRFSAEDKAVPHIGWNSAIPVETNQCIPGLRTESKYYYVHSFKVPYAAGQLEAQGWSVATAQYGGERFVGVVAKDNVLATQFHPEKSGVAGLRVIKAFLDGEVPRMEEGGAGLAPQRTDLTRRIIACLDVRTNDAGDLVVTKGDQYDVREKESSAVRNLGKPVDMARKYYKQGADEIIFLNITSFRDCPVRDLPMLEILRRTSETVFVPLTVGGGIRDIRDPDGTVIDALDVAKLYFESGADKVSIGSDAVIAAEAYWAAGGKASGTTAIERISAAYGNQAVVVSVDPKMVWVDNDKLDAAPSTDTAHLPRPSYLRTTTPGPSGQTHYWYACTTHGGRTTSALDVVGLARAAAALGTGELLLNSIDRDGGGAGFDHALVQLVKDAVDIPVIASSGAGQPAHFVDVFRCTSVDAALGAGMFHRGEFTVGDVKRELAREGLLVRAVEEEQG